MPVNKCTVLQASVYYITDYCLFKQIVDKLIEGIFKLKAENTIS